MRGIGRRRPWLCALVVAVLAAPAMAAVAAPATPLERFLDGLETWRGEFTQEVVDGRGRRVDSGSGVLLVRRPGRFRWEYRPRNAGEGAGQLLVADGRNLWFFDRDLEQVTVKPLGQSLSATPLLLLSASVDELHRAFEQQPGGRRDGLEWVSVQPRSAAAEFARAAVGFQGARLVRMVITDRLGQTVTLVFTRAERNARVADQDLRFEPPAGADVIGTPVPASPAE
ncbi:MAG: outer membrane lipoprotein chaperone LolA [Gammaproteobacteria bacterium]|nr:outer membrane lipoprotein chaperone LolA [Gammaproteobacteria bacterium]